MVAILIQKINLSLLGEGASVYLACAPQQFRFSLLGTKVGTPMGVGNMAWAKECVKKGPLAK